jgi:hypothetical protein
MNPKNFYLKFLLMNFFFGNFLWNFFVKCLLMNFFWKFLLLNFLQLKHVYLTILFSHGLVRRVKKRMMGHPWSAVINVQIGTIIFVLESLLCPKAVGFVPNVQRIKWRRKVKAKRKSDRHRLLIFYYSCFSAFIFNTRVKFEKFIKCLQ